MFKNLHTYRLAPDCWPALDAVEQALAAERFAECGPTQTSSAGWVPPRGHEHGALAEPVGNDIILKLQIETRVVPSEVVKRRVDELVQKIEQETGRKPGKKVKNELKEQAMQDLLPSAFTKRSAVKVWIAPDLHLLLIDATTATRADDVVTVLGRSIEGLQVHLLQTAETPAACMAAWLTDGQPPDGFTIDRECELKSEDEMKSVVRYARHPLDIEEVRQHLAAGKRPTKLALTWRDRVSFLLTDALTIKKIAFLDIVFEGRDKPSRDETFDADAALACGELRQLIPQLLDALGGEHDFYAAAMAAASAASAAGEPDELLSKAIALVKAEKRASISQVQRHLQIGYNRAARLLESMEVQRIVSPMQTDGTRRLL